jgi:uncharacterized protein
MKRTVLSLVTIILCLAWSALCAVERPPQMNLTLLQGRFSVCRLPPQAAVPEWANARSTFSSITRTSDELSIVCVESVIPENVKQESGWRVLKIEGPLDFGLVGILVSVIDPLREAGISILAISTFDTDYVMVKDQKVEKALQTLKAAGHTVTISG